MAVRDHLKGLGWKPHKEIEEGRHLGQNTDPSLSFALAAVAALAGS